MIIVRRKIWNSNLSYRFFTQEMNEETKTIIKKIIK